MALSTKSGVLETFAAPKSLSDQDSQGTQLGDNSVDLISFYGVPSIAQPGVGPAAYLAGASNDLATLTKYQHTLATTATGASTTAEITSSVTGILVGDLVAVNKPAAQTGLGVAGYRVSAANAIGITFCNISSGSITNTSTDAWDVIGVSAGLATTASLSPAAVAAAGAEQILSVPGATVGSFPIINKPTQQNGLGISNVRVVAAGQVAVTFLNNSSGAITPTAAETYGFAFLPTLQPVNSLQYKMSWATSSIAATTTTDVSTTITGLLANDVIAGASKPSYQAGIGVVGYRVSAANTAYLTYVSQSSGAITTTYEAYGVTVMRLAPKAPFVVSTATLTPVSVAATTSAEQTFTVPFLNASTSVLVSKPSYTAGIHVVGARVSAASTLALTFQNNNTSAVVPPAEVYTIAAIPLQGPGAVTTAGTTTNSIAVSASPSASAVKDIRAALQNLGLMATV